MNLFGALDISASALQAERVRAEVIAANMANSETTRTADGGVYQREHVVFAAQDGSSFQESLLAQAGMDQGGYRIEWAAEPAERVWSGRQDSHGKFSGRAAGNRDREWVHAGRGSSNGNRSRRERSIEAV